MSEAGHRASFPLAFFRRPGFGRFFEGESQGFRLFGLAQRQEQNDEQAKNDQDDRHYKVGQIWDHLGQEIHGQRPPEESVQSAMLILQMVESIRCVKPRHITVESNNQTRTTAGMSISQFLGSGSFFLLPSRSV